MKPGTRVLVEGVAENPHPFYVEAQGLIAVNISDLLFTPDKVRPLADVERLEMRVKELESKITREIRFALELADECDRAGTDFAKGRSQGIRDLVGNILSSISTLKEGVR